MNKSQIIRYIGIFIVLVCLWFVGQQVIESISQGKLVWGRGTLRTIFLGSIVYSFLLLTLSTAWWHIVNGCEGAKLAFANAYWVYARSQIAKYLPGNFFQYAGRHVLGKKFDLTHSTLAIALFIETGFLVLVSLLLVLAGTASYNLLRVGMDLIKEVVTPFYMIVIFTILFLVAIIIVYFFSQKPKPVSKLMNSVPKKSKSKWLSYLAVPFLLYAVFFVGNGILIFVICSMEFNNSLQYEGIIYLISIFSLAWLVGFVTPGAPGGVGVRETIIILTMSPLLMKGQALELALIYRLITIFGDGWFFLSTYFIKGRCGVVYEENK